MTGIKFCGLTRAVDAEAAASLGASHVGVVFAESARQLRPAAAREVFEAAGDNVKRVAVFGRATVADIMRTASESGADVIQLHGSRQMVEIAALRARHDGEIWTVVGVSPSGWALPADCRDLADVADAIVLDTSVGGVTGGTGQTLDWSGLSHDVAALAAFIPVILAGGLNPENVTEAIGLLSPSIVDVSSGVESAPGIKDHERMRAFAEAVHSASICVKVCEG